MILSGRQIAASVDRREITIDPFDPDLLNPNSYNYRLHPEILLCNGNNKYSLITIPETGILIEPHLVYLAATLELIGSSQYVTTLLGRSSMGRLGLFLNITADFGHVGSLSKWTLELTAVQPLRIYPRMQIGQVAFWETLPSVNPYAGRYLYDHLPNESKDADACIFCV